MDVLECRRSKRRRRLSQRARESDRPALFSRILLPEERAMDAVVQALLDAAEWLDAHSLDDDEDSEPPRIVADHVGPITLDDYDAVMSE